MSASAVAEPLSKGKAALGDYLKMLALGDHRGVVERYGEKAALTEAYGNLGGYLIPTELRYDLMAAVAEQAIFRRLCPVIETKTPETLLPIPAAPVASGTAGVPSWFGGIQLSFAPTTTGIPETEPTFRDVDLKVYPLDGYVTASNPLIDDGGEALGTWLHKLFVDAVAWFEDWYFINGNGVGQPLGVLKTKAAKTVTRQTANKVTLQDVTVMLGGLLPRSYRTAIWMVHPTVIPQITNLSNTGGSGVWQANEARPAESDDGGSIGALFGRPLYVSDKCATLGTQGDTILFDPQQYAIADHQKLSVVPSVHVKFLSNQVVFRIYERIDGRPTLDASAPVTLQDQATTVSAYVYLV